jgi:hypothetical protein
MKVYDGVSCRLGNAIFRYMASSLFCILYNADRKYNENEKYNNVTEDFYKLWCDNILYNNKLLEINNTINLKFGEFYQTDIYKLYRTELIKHFENNKEDIIVSDDVYKHNKYKVSDLIPNNDIQKYKIVLHIRLEDFVTSGEKLIIHPQSICEILDTLYSNNNSDSICLVCNKLTTDFEKKYINYFKQKYNIIFESNDIITDFKIMNNAEILICSLSTICWSAGFLSKNIKQVFFPKNKYHGWTNQSFSTIISNTTYYDNILTTERELLDFLQ